MRRRSMPLRYAVLLLVVGLLLGSVFTFGMQHWNAKKLREACTLVETEFLAYDEIRERTPPYRLKEIAIDCANEDRYFVDGACLNEALQSKLSCLPAHTPITLLIHPNSSTIVFFATETETLMEFSETMEKLEGEATGFLFLGIFLYVCAAVGLCYILLHVFRGKKK